MCKPIALQSPHVNGAYRTWGVCGLRPQGYNIPPSAFRQRITLQALDPMAQAALGLQTHLGPAVPHPLLARGAFNWYPFLSLARPSFYVCQITHPFPYAEQSPCLARCPR
jgi:hypothetical protein